MKQLLGFGLAVVTVGAITLTALLSQAAVGDAIWVSRDADGSAYDGVLDSAPKRNAVRDLIRALPGGAGLAITDVQEVECFQVKRGATSLLLELRANWVCRGKKRNGTQTDAEFLDDVLLGNVKRYEQGGGTQVLGPVSGAGATTEIDNVTETVFGLDIAVVAHFGCQREEVGNPTCFYYEIKTDTPANFKAALDAGTVAGLIGKVTE